MKKHSTIPKNTIFSEARLLAEYEGMVDGEINATIIFFILRAKEFNRNFKNTYKKLYPLLTQNGQKLCDKMLEQYESKASNP